MLCISVHIGLSQLQLQYQLQLQRSLYDCLCIDYKLPSIRTLTRLTSKISSMEDLSFINSIFMNLNPLKGISILLIDEVYVKASLLYQRGALFGQAVNYPEKLAKTILSFMIKCLFGGPEFICRAQPVANLSSEFQFAQCQQIVYTINNIENSKTLVIITDGNQVNQRFFGMFKTVDSKPWLTTSGIYLLYDYVHLLESIRNNWLTKKTGELQFLNNKELALAKWSDLETIYKTECNSLFKLSKLTAKSVYPKPIERQSVKFCLSVFCKKTVAVLRTHPEIENKAFEGTAVFIEKIIFFRMLLMSKHLVLAFGLEMNYAKKSTQLVINSYNCYEILLNCQIL
ncbi:uncharacterized protein LOC136083651 [Hydra vulgaris]|uniref:Uncharacterized protein LOC136083651 n=1 Tax=Hydra vulgaris TaxID=6087 RepID=A0ABM4CC29_HYDVU